MFALGHRTGRPLTSDGPVAEPEVVEPGQAAHLAHERVLREALAALTEAGAPVPALADQDAPVVYYDVNDNVAALDEAARAAIT